ncbi:MAG: DUF2155 domain-containing protein [Pseudomonadota bacterium]
MRALAFLLIATLAQGAAAQQSAERGNGAVLRWLDRINSQSADIEIANASANNIGDLRVELGECRYPSGNPSGDAFAYLTVHESDTERPVFAGWMITSSPALNPFEHPRYDIWVLRCT